MAAVTMAMANTHCRKRSYNLVHEQDLSANRFKTESRKHAPRVRSITLPASISPQRPTPKRRTKTVGYKPSMPVNIAPVMSTTYPSFMSVYGSDEVHLEAVHVESSHPHRKEEEVHLNTQANPRTHSLPFPIYHRGSVNSFNSESTTSTPTTTQSSPVFTDPSPTSSPESASSNPPMSHFKGTLEPSNHERHKTPDQPITLRQTDLSPDRIPDSPNGLGRNVKNLSLNMSTSANTTAVAKAASSGSPESFQAFSAPTSPLKEPVRSGRKKPTNLTIRTPGFQQLTFSRPSGEVPPTPTSRPSLHTFQSSPSILSLITPTTSSSGGLHLSLPSFGSGHSRPGSDSSFSSQGVGGSLPDLKEEFEPHRSQETQERGYPDGPICIYDCGVWLYLEPTAEEASKFDTVINVAEEIKDPFTTPPAENKTVMAVWRDDKNTANIVDPQTAVSDMSFKSAWEFQPVESTPPEISTPVLKRPEYLHVPWGHNSEILEDLFPLCSLIDRRVQEGKKVLIHCQLGVSRSASLTIAYGLWRGYQSDFHSMYMQVKDRSRWVGPNMSLIYQLTDFRSKVARGDYANCGRAAPASWFKHEAPDSANRRGSLRNEITALSLSERTTPKQETAEDNFKTPTAPPLRPIRLDKDLPPVPPFSNDEKPRIPHIAAQMVEIPQWTGKPALPSPRLTSDGTARITTMEPRQLPFRKLADYDKSPLIPSHKPQHAVPRNIIVAPPTSKMDLLSQDVPSTPSTFSPRATEFLASPFGFRSSAGDLAVNGHHSARSIGSVLPPKRVFDTNTSQEIRKPRESILPTNIDPRSPHQQGDVGGIIRSIDHFL